MNANDKLLDLIVGHQVDLQQYSAYVVRRAIALLNRSDADLMAQLTAALDRLPAGSFTVERLESLLVAVRQVNFAAYQALERELTAELTQFAGREAAFHPGAVKSAMGPQVAASVTVVAISPQQVVAAALAQPFRGRLLREWAASIEADRMARIRDTIRIGYVEQQTVAQIVQRIRGTRAKGYSDGVIEIDRRSAEAIVRTAISHVAAVARDKFYEDNDDLIKAVAWVSTLDGRTSSECRLRDSLQYTPETRRPIGHSVPWKGGPGRLHWRCRSTSAPVLKSWRELGIPLDSISPATRAAMDGQTPADLTYGKWLKRQPAARQDEILGPTRGALLRRDGLDLADFYTDRGAYLTLDELAERDAAAFRRAGV